MGQRRLTGYVDVIVGAQYGDEGKGKVVDLIGGDYDIVVRYQGGANSGHTVISTDGIKHIFRILPSSVLRPNVISVLGNGVVVDPVVLAKELRSIPDNSDVLLSTKAHITFPFHRVMDMVTEAKGNKIGSTCRGNSPTYVDKYARTGIQFGMINESGDLPTAYALLRRQYERKLLAAGIDAPYYSFELDGMPILDYEALWLDSLSYIMDRVSVVRTEDFLYESILGNKKILLEGAQGAMLDVDFGDYPYVTSSHVTSGGACIGSGIPPTAIRKVMGVCKLYTTRVGAGRFSTELYNGVGKLNPIGKLMSDVGCEFGSVTGRARRCGWLDLDELKYSCRINGISELYIMKSDVLTGIEEVKIMIDGKYRCFDGWTASQMSDVGSIPEELSDMIDSIEAATEAKVVYVSKGAERNNGYFRYNRGYGVK